MTAIPITLTFDSSALPVGPQGPQGPQGLQGPPGLDGAPGLRGLGFGINVKDHGATGDGTTDDSTAFQAALDALELTGGLLFVPKGKYYLATGVTLDLSNYDQTGDFLAVGIQGDGAGCTAILVEPGTTGLTIQGEATGARMNAKIAGLGFFPKGAGGSGIGLSVDNVAFGGFEDLLFSSLEYGMRATDMVSCDFHRCRWEFNRYGMDIQGRVNFASANALSFKSCTLRNNTEWGGRVFEGGCLSWFGGSIEGNGRTGTGPDRCGLKLQNMGRASAAGAAFFGAYMENNSDKADVWIDQSAYQATYSFHGCSFQRIQNVNPATNNILLSGGTAALSLQGNGFRGAGTYVADVSRKYVAVTGTVTIDEGANLWGSAVEKPTWAA
jgi:hypothetical protein